MHRVKESIDFVVTLCFVGFFLICGCEYKEEQLQQKKEKKTQQSVQVTVAAVRTNPPLPTEYAILVDILSDDWSFDSNAPDQEEGIIQLQVELQGAILDLKNFESSDLDLNLLADDTLKKYEDILSAVQEIKSLPEIPSGLEQWGFTLPNLLRLAEYNLSDVSDSIEGTQKPQKAILNEWKKFERGISMTQSIKRLLPRIAQKYSGPEVVEGQAILVDFDEAWGPFGPKSEIRLINNGEDLTNCTILVEVQSSTEIARNVHFISEWKKEKTIYASYLPSKKYINEVFKQTVPNADQIVISIWSDQVTQTKMRYKYAGKERDKDIARYCESVQISMNYRPFETGVLWNTNRRVNLKLEGISFLSDPEITVQFERDNQLKSLSWKQEYWEQGETKQLDTEGKLEWDPKKIRVKISFPASEYRHVISFNLTQ